MDVALNHTGIDQSLWDGRIFLSASFFHNYIRDVIAFVPSGPVTGSYANQNTGETYGIETELRANPFKSWQIRAAFTWRREKHCSNESQRL
jgi:outer membrane receptor protein involved in Fe transport